MVLAYALHALHQAGALAHLAFKGGTCLRKTVFGSTGRFSEDLDFTLDSDEPEDDVLMHLLDVLNREHHGVGFSFATSRISSSSPSTFALSKSSR